MTRKLLPMLVVVLLLACCLTSCSSIKPKPSLDTTLSSKLASCDDNIEPQLPASSSQSSMQDNPNDSPTQITYSTTVDKWIDAFSFLESGNINASFRFYASNEEITIDEHGTIKRYNGLEYEKRVEEKTTNGETIINNQSESYLDTEQCSMGFGTLYNSLISKIKRYITGEDCSFSTFSYSEDEKCYIKVVDEETIRVYFENDILYTFEVKKNNGDGEFFITSFSFLPVEAIIFPTEDAIVSASSALNSLSTATSITCSNSYGYTTDASTEEILTAITEMISSFTLDNPSFYSVGDAVYFEFEDVEVKFLDTTFTCDSIIIDIKDGIVKSFMIPDNAYMQIRFKY